MSLADLGLCGDGDGDDFGVGDAGNFDDFIGGGDAVDDTNDRKDIRALDSAFEQPVFSGLVRKAF